MTITGTIIAFLAAPFMLRKADCEKPVRTTPGTVEDLVAWLRTKPADGIYNPRYPENCLLAQYGKARGSRTSSSYFWASRKLDGSVERYVAWGLTGNVKDLGQLTYGAALTRALEYQRACT